MNQDMQFSHIINKIQELKQGKNPLDLSTKEDLAVGIMNLVSMEEHFFFTYNKTKDEKYLELLNETRNIRKNLLLEIVKNPKGEVWCISKHLLAVIMRLMEVGTKKLSDKEEAAAKDLFQKAYMFWNIFWGLNLGIINVKDVDMEDDADDDDDEENNSNDNPSNKKGASVNLINDGNNRAKKLNLFSKLGKIIEDVLNCCKE